MCRKVLCYGDSNTFGYDPRSYFGGRYPETIRWTALLEQQGWSILNEGENGRSIPRRKWEIEAVLQTICQFQPDIVTVMLGSNDLLQAPDLSAEECAGRMECFLENLLGRNFFCKYLLIVPPPMSFGAWISDNKTVEISQALAGHYQTAADRLGIHFADTGAWDIGLAFDGVHFSEAGHLTFANEIALVLKRIAAKPAWEGLSCSADERNQPYLHMIKPERFL